MNSVSMMTISATVAIAKKMPRNRKVISPVPNPSRPLITAAARICTASGAPIDWISTTEV